MDRWRSFSSAVSPVWLSPFLARPLCLLFPRFVGISLDRPMVLALSLAGFTRLLSRPLARSLASSPYRSLPLLLFRSLVLFRCLPVSLACLLAFSLSHFLAFLLVLSLPRSRSPAFVLLSLVLALYRSPA